MARNEAIQTVSHLRTDVKRHGEERSHPDASSLILIVWFASLRSQRRKAAVRLPEDMSSRRTTRKRTMGAAQLYRRALVLQVLNVLVPTD